MTYTLNTPAVTADMTGNALNVTQVGLGSVVVGSAPQVNIYAGSGTPTFTAPQGSLFLSTNGSSTTTRAFISEGSGTWTSITTAA